MKKGEIWISPWTIWAKTHNLARHSQPLSAKYFLQTGAYHTAMGTKNYTFAFKEWCARKIQEAWRYRRRKRWLKYQRRPIYTLAAIDIQRCWRDFKKRTVIKIDASMWKHRPASVIQRAYRRYTQRRIYRYFRDLILARQACDPVVLLKVRTAEAQSCLHDICVCCAVLYPMLTCCAFHCIEFACALLEQTLSPADAPVCDSSCGLYVRFRLGGASFPPIIYFKIYTTQSVLDINAFAPRNYVQQRRTRVGVIHTRSQFDVSDAQGQKDRAEWYQRWENNGWRPITDKVLAEKDPVLQQTAAKKIPYFHPNKLVRRQEREKQKKLKKLNWLKKLYASGGHTDLWPQEEEKQAEQGAEHDDAEAAEDDESEPEWPSEDEDSEAVQARRRRQRQRAAIDKIMSVNPAKQPAALSNNNDWEAEADELLQWCTELDFDSYQSTWLSTATTRPANPHYRKQVGLASTVSVLTDQLVTGSGSTTTQATLNNLTLYDEARVISGGASAAETGMKGTIHPYINLTRVNLNSDRSHREFSNTASPEPFPQSRQTVSSQHQGYRDSEYYTTPPPQPHQSFLPPIHKSSVVIQDGRSSRSGRQSKPGKQFTLPI